jgi:beta-galactosidase
MAVQLIPFLFGTRTGASSSLPREGCGGIAREQGGVYKAGKVSVPAGSLVEDPAYAMQSHQNKNAGVACGPGYPFQVLTPLRCVPGFPLLSLTRKAKKAGNVSTLLMEEAMPHQGYLFVASHPTKHTCAVGATPNHADIQIQDRVTPPGQKGFATCFLQTGSPSGASEVYPEGEVGDSAIPSHREGVGRGSTMRKASSNRTNPSLPQHKQPHPSPWEGTGTFRTLSSGEGRVRPLLLALCFILSTFSLKAQSTRQDISLNSSWKTIADDTNIKAHNGFEQTAFNDKSWKIVDVPHNWDDYGGYRRLKHGNRHGYAWYRKTFTVANQSQGKRYFLYFEGVGSYATVWLNGKQVGYHAGGRTTFTLDVTDAIKPGKANLLTVRADHPSFIKNLPWVCGACSDDPGFSEGSQPMGIFRPVHLIVTNPVRIQPFGVHIWNDTTVSEKSATLNLETEVKNYNGKPANISISNKLVDATGKTIAVIKANKKLNAGEGATIAQVLPKLNNVHLWDLQNPYLYQLVTEISTDGKIIDRQTTPYGIRWISWPIGRNNGDSRFFLNGKPVFINGTAEYEHLMGKSHAFSPQEIKARVMQVRAAGFNAFRDAHQPHNLAYQSYWDKMGLLWWPQYSAHIWYDSKEFREEFKTLLIDWVKERRNSPSNILWGLQNESRLPEDFAKECSDLIRKLDPTSSSQRKITTCNGGRGTDWDVPQNWTGTYGGNPLTYSEDLKKQNLVGEYGAWRSEGLHTEGPFNQNGPQSEERFAQLMETKVRLAEAVKDQISGQFHWLLYSHENPGRTQGGEGMRELDRVGPVNYKGLFTAWGQPTDAFYMFRANYAPKDKEPMAYIVSHTWPNRWLKPGKKDSIVVYSNCDEIELFNDINHASLGKKKRGGIGTHFQWDGVDIKYNVLYAVGYVNGKAVAKDQIVLNHLPVAPGLVISDKGSAGILKPADGYQYVWRLNCGGPSYKDSFGNWWEADNPLYYSHSWANDFAGIPPAFGSQQRTFDPVSGTADGGLFQTFRYGLDKLSFPVPVSDGDYRVELFFTEPWYGAGGGLDCTGWRLFDVAVNGQTKIKNLDIWKEAGYNHALKKTVNAHVANGMLVINFPQVSAGQAIISAIAVSTLKKNNNAAALPHVEIKDGPGILKNWLDIGQQQYTNSSITISNLPPVLYGADWFQAENKALAYPAKLQLPETAVNIYIAMDVAPAQRPEWLHDYEVTGLYLENDYQGGTKMPLYRKKFSANSVIKFGANNGALMYTVAVIPVNNMEPATDLRKTISYSAEGATVQGNDIAKDTLSGKKVARFTKTNGGSVTFAIAPGVADMYAIRIKYYNFTDKVLAGKMQLLAADGTLMKEENLTFKTVAKNKSGTVATSTGTSINAGNYKLVITGLDAEGLSISGVEIQ